MSNSKEQSLKNYTIIRDSREKVNYWEFTNDKVLTLPTGDYTIEGFADKFVIERKATMSEFAGNLFQDRFERELERLDKIELAYLVLEFSLDTLYSFPVGSGIPKFRWPYLKTNPHLLAKRFLEIQIAHPNLKIIFAGNNAYNIAKSIFKRVIEKYDS